MKNFPLIFFALLFLPFCSAYEYPPPPVYPVAPSGPEFQKEAEAFVIAKSVHLSGLSNKDQFVSDPREWEPVLEKLIRQPSVHGITVSGVAFRYTVYRGTAKKPEIVAATGEWFNRHIQGALERYDKYSHEGSPQHPSVAGPLPNTIHGILEVDSPSHLTSVLNYLNSPADEKIGIIELATSKEVAAALRSYGEGIHLEAAEKFAKRLRDSGKGDIAEDIDRSIDRIKKDMGQKRSATSGSESIQATKNSPASIDTKESRNNPVWPWIVAGGAFIAALVAYFRMKRAET